MSDYWDDYGDDRDWDYWDDYGEAEREDAWRYEEDEEDHPRRRRRKRGLLKKIVEWLKYSLAIALLAALLTASMAPAMAQGRAPSGGYEFSYRLLGLSKNLYGVHAEPGWMLIVGQDGLITEARNVNGMWVYEPITMGGPDLKDVVWEADRGIAIGNGRAVLLQKIGDAITARDLPFLVDDYLIASWSPKKDFAVLVAKNSIYYYELGSQLASVLIKGVSPLLVLKTYNINYGDNCAWIASYSREARETILYLVKICEGGRVERIRISAGKDLGSAIARLTQVANATKMMGAGKGALSPVELIRGILRVAFSTIKSRSLEQPMFTGAVGYVDGDLVIAVALRGSNIVTITRGNLSKTYALAFPAENVYPFEKGRNLLFAVVGDGGGVAIIDPEIDTAIYCSVPSAYKIAFLDEDTALITSPYGLFIYNFTSVEYFPMPSPPTSVHVGSKIRVADGSGQIYELIRPQPWKGGITLSNLIQGGRVIDIEDSAESEILLVRKGTLRGAGVGVEKGLSNWVEDLIKTSGKGKQSDKGVATFGKESAVFYLKDAGIKRIESPILGEDVELTDMASFADGKALLVGLKGKVYKLSGTTLEPISCPEADYYVAERSPLAPIAIIAGKGIILIYDEEDDSIDRVPAPTTTLLSAAFSPDGSYALIGGAGTLAIYDVDGLHEMSQKHVVEYLYLAAKPNSHAFLASTSLGLMEVKEDARPRYESIKAEGYYRIIGSGLVELRYRAVSSKVLTVDDYRVVCSIPCEVESTSVPSEFRPLKAEEITVRLSFNKEDLPDSGNVTALVKFVTPDGEVYDLPPVSFRPEFASGISLETFFSPAIIQPIIIAVVMAVLVIVAVKYLRKWRKKAGEFEEGSEEPSEGWSRRGFGEEMGDEFLD